VRRSQVVEGEIQGLVAPREDRVAHEGLDTFDDGGSEMLDDSARPMMMSGPRSFPSPLEVMANRMPKHPLASDRNAAASALLAVPSQQSGPAVGTGTRVTVLVP
jgi:hypothetical protein